VKIWAADAIIVDCPGDLEDTETLTGVLAAATCAVIPMVPERAAVQPTLRTARLCEEHKVPHRVVLNMADPLRGAGPVESAWKLLDDLGVPRMVSFVRPVRGAQPEPGWTARRSRITAVTAPGRRHWPTSAPSRARCCLSSGGC